MTTAPQVPLVDATAMNRFHRILREALASAPSFVGAAPEGDTDRAELVGTYYDNVLRLLHAHHEAEDVTLFPWLLERLPDQVDLITGVNAEHELVLGTLHATEEAVAAWRSDPSSAHRDSAVRSLAELETVLLDHLDHEEAEIVPLIGQVINVAEWGAMSAEAFRRFSGDKPWLAIGLIQEQMLDAENAGMEANMPPPVRDFWVSTGRPQFEVFVGELRS
jgi:hemerythrin-like domain-containing protein